MRMAAALDAVSSAYDAHRHRSTSAPLALCVSQRREIGRRHTTLHEAIRPVREASGCTLQFASPLAVVSWWRVGSTECALIGGVGLSPFCFLGEHMYSCVCVSVCWRLCSNAAPLAQTQGFADEPMCDHCATAWVPVVIFLMFNIMCNVFTILVIKHGSAALSFLISTLRMPLAALAFSSPAVMGAEAVPAGPQDSLASAGQAFFPHNLQGFLYKAGSAVTAVYSTRSAACSQLWCREEGRRDSHVVFGHAKSFVVCRNMLRRSVKHLGTRCWDDRAQGIQSARYEGSRQSPPGFGDLEGSLLGGVAGRGGSIRLVPSASQRETTQVWAPHGCRWTAVRRWGGPLCRAALAGASGGA